ncbi:MAG: hypothetical protein HY698_17865 [Deltaproteobacteria bacterium]|nr:hypothetical protein [Deltaproteobacteria bacterium]
MTLALTSCGTEVMCKGGHAMALKQNEVYICPKMDCGCEIRVTKGAGPGAGSQSPRCCCGQEMQKKA